MSFEPDNIEHDNSNESLLKEILYELKIISSHLRILTDEEITEEDIG